MVLSPTINIIKMYDGDSYTQAGYTLTITNITLGQAYIKVVDSSGVVVASGTMKPYGVQKDWNPVFVPTAQNAKFSLDIQSADSEGIWPLIKYFVMAQVTTWTDEVSEPVPEPEPEPTPSPGPDIAECTFPTLSWNLISVLSALIGWIGCMLKNVIKLLQYITDWLLHFPDHLDAWISNLFGIDPALPFFPELMRKIDIYVSARLGVDPEKPLLDEISKKLLEWFFSLLDSKADQAPRKWR